MICMCCGARAPVMERVALESLEGGVIRRVVIENQPICDDCRVAIARRGAENDQLRREQDE